MRRACSAAISSAASGRPPTKDLGIALAGARRMNLSLPGLGLAEQPYVAARAQGLGRKGTHALLPALARVSAIEWR
jgi:3-hydroxyisobutyrate dehydrogenase